jgi:guanyl-specific ribonuclease Sa
MGGNDMNKIRKYLSQVMIMLLLFVPTGLLSACGNVDNGNDEGIVTETYESVVEALSEIETTVQAFSEQTETEQTETLQNETEQIETEQIETLQSETVQVQNIDEDGTYTSKEDVALYIYTYGHLPDNFITKKEAEKLGWSGGSLEPYAPGKCIGGSRFGNYEGILPEKDGRTYTECDIDTLGADKRGAKRIVFSNDGLIYYTEDHYTTFELLYGDE